MVPRRNHVAALRGAEMSDPTIEEQAINVVANEYYRRGFEAAKVAALAAIEDTDTVECNHSYYAQLGDASATKSNILEAVRKIEPEVTR